MSRIGRCLLFYLLGSLFVFPLAKAGEAPNRKTEIADYKALHFECKQRPYAFGLRLQCEEKQGKYSYEFRLRGKPLIDIYANQSYQSNLRSEFSIKCHISD